MKPVHIASAEHVLRNSLKQRHECPKIARRIDIQEQIKALRYEKAGRGAADRARYAARAAALAKGDFAALR